MSTPHTATAPKIGQSSSQNSVLIGYQNSLVSLNSNLRREKAVRLYSLLGSAGCATLGALLIVPAFLYRTLPMILVAIPLISGVALYRRYLSSGHRWLTISQKIDYFERGIQRLTASWQRQGESGEEFAREGHLYQSDLNILGKGSLFELLCTARSKFGSERLASYLLDPVDQNETRRRQQAVRELVSFSHLREEIHRLGDHRSDDCGVGSFTPWFSMQPLVYHPSIRYALLLSTSASAILGLGIFSKALLWTHWALPIVVLIAFHLVVAGILFTKTRPRLLQLRLLTNAFTVLREGLSILEQQNFQSPKLQELTERARSANASARVRTMERLARLLDQREKMGFYALALLLAVGTQLVLAMEAWRALNQQDFLSWVDIWAEFEALQALAGYAFEQPDTVFPDFVEGDLVLQAHQMGHPLIETDRCVRNDVTLNTHSRFYIVSGSNMAGKSTFLRAIGLNVVVALAGGPVRATSAKLSQLTVCASLAVTDSLLEGRSKFLAEVERLGAMIAAHTADRPVLFLVDEIFSGTNSQDRKTAGESVIDMLLQRGAIGAVSTHDLTITEMAADSARSAVLVHMEGNNPDDPLDFDYLVKPGVATRSNGMSIVKLITESAARTHTVVKT